MAWQKAETENGTMPRGWAGAALGLAVAAGGQMLIWPPIIPALAAVFSAVTALILWFRSVKLAEISAISSPDLPTATQEIAMAETIAAPLISDCVEATPDLANSPPPPVASEDQDIFATLMQGWVLAAILDGDGRLLSANTGFLDVTGLLPGDTLVEPVVELTNSNANDILLQNQRGAPLHLMARLFRHPTDEGWVFLGFDRSDLPKAAELDPLARKAMDEIETGLRLLAIGETPSPVEGPVPDLMEPIRQSFNQAVQHLSNGLGHVASELSPLHDKVSELASASAALAQQGQSLSASLTGMSARASEVEDAMLAATKDVLEAGEAVGLARRNVEESHPVLTETRNTMDMIAASSGQIGKTLKVIEGIAFQTNLLALNAGVEAARAGDAGRGFAVVAAEVRALAQRASNAAREIGALVDESNGHVRLGVEQVAKSGAALQQMVSAVSAASARMEHLMRGAQEQTKGMAEIKRCLLDAVPAAKSYSADVMKLRTQADDLLTRNEMALRAVAEIIVRPDCAAQAADVCASQVRAPDAATTRGHLHATNDRHETQTPAHLAAARHAARVASVKMV